MNQITLSGFVCNEPVMTQVKTGATVVNFNIAVKDDRKTSEGVYPTYYFRISCWGYVAEFVKKYIKRDNFVIVTGKMKQDKYADRLTGKQNYVYSIVADHVENAQATVHRDPATRQAAGNRLLEYTDVKSNVEPNEDAMYT